MIKTKIYAVHYNRPDFIPWQKFCLDAFFVQPFEFIIINNARELNLRKDINHVANHNLGLSVIETHSETPFNLCGQHHADALNYAWKNYIIKDEVALVLDGDVFLLDKFDIHEEFFSTVLGSVKYTDFSWAAFGVPQHRKTYNYISPTVVGVNLLGLPDKENLDWSGLEVEPGVHLDTGGGWWTWCHQGYVKPMINSWHISYANANWHVLPPEMAKYYKNGYDVELYGDRWLHYCRSSAWDWSGEDYHLEKSAWVMDFIKNRLDNKIKLSYTNFDIPTNEWLGWVYERKR